MNHFQSDLFQEDINNNVKSKNDDIPDRIIGLYGAINYLLDVKLPKYKTGFRGKNKDVYKFKLGKITFTMQCISLNNEVGVYTKLIFPRKFHDFFKTNEYNLINQYGDCLEITIPNKDCLLIYYHPLPESNLLDCSKEQIIEISKDITDIIISVIRNIEKSRSNLAIAIKG